MNKKKQIEILGGTLEKYWDRMVELFKTRDNNVDYCLKEIRNLTERVYFLENRSISVEKFNKLLDHLGIEWREEIKETKGFFKKNKRV